MQRFRAREGIPLKEGLRHFTSTHLIQELFHRAGIPLKEGLRLVFAWVDVRC